MMTGNVRKVFAIALVLVALVSIFVPIVSAGRTPWYLGSVHTGDGYPLTKTVPGDGTVDFADGAWKEWHSECAQCDLTIGAGTWTMDLDYTAPTGGTAGTADILIWYWSDQKSRTMPDPGSRSRGDETIGEVYGVTLATGADTTSVDIVGVAKDFSAANEDYILLYIRWNEGSNSGNLLLNCGDGDSTLTTPTSDPGFPVPEMSTLVLFSVGLLALVGYVAYRRRKI